MKTVLIIHEAFQTPASAWYTQIGSIIPSDYRILTPELPSGSLQGAIHWMQELEKYRAEINSNTIIIAHGLGTLAAVRLIESLTSPVRMFITVAGTIDAPSHQIYRPIAESFLEKTIDIEKVKMNAGKIFHIWNKQDPFIPIELSAQMAEKIIGKNFTLSGTEHFLETSEVELMGILSPLFEIVGKEDAAKAEQVKVIATEEQKERMAKASVPAVVTYDTDVAQSVSGYQGRVISELLTTAREEEAAQKEKSPTNFKNLAYIIGTSVLILGGLGFLGAAIVTKIPKTAATIQRINKYESKLIHVETTIPFEISGQEQYLLQKSLIEIQNPDVPEKEFASIVPVDRGIMTTLEKFRLAIDMKTPTGFTAKAEDYLYGYYHTSTGITAPFLLIQFEGFDVLDTIMRKWEPTMFRDMARLFYPEEVSTSILKTEDSIFETTMAKNILTRTATMSTGKTIAYTFLTDHTLLITTTPAVAEPVLRRMIGR